MPLEPCCTDPANLELKPDHPDARPGLEVRVCRLCDRRHFELMVDPGVVGLRGASLRGA